MIRVFQLCFVFTTLWNPQMNLSAQCCCVLQATGEWGAQSRTMMEYVSLDRILRWACWIAHKFRCRYRYSNLVGFHQLVESWIDPCLHNVLQYCKLEVNEEIDIGRWWNSFPLDRIVRLARWIAHESPFRYRSSMLVGFHQVVESSIEQCLYNVFDCCNLGVNEELKLKRWWNLFVSLDRILRLSCKIS